MANPNRTEYVPGSYKRPDIEQSQRADDEQRRRSEQERQQLDQHDQADLDTKDVEQAPEDDDRDFDDEIVDLVEDQLQDGYAPSFDHVPTSNTPGDLSDPEEQKKLIRYFDQERPWMREQMANDQARDDKAFEEIAMMDQAERIEAQRNAPDQTLNEDELDADDHGTPSREHRALSGSYIRSRRTDVRLAGFLSFWLSAFLYSPQAAFRAFWFSVIRAMWHFGNPLCQIPGILAFWLAVIL